jgi:hypothetical protein
MESLGIEDSEDATSLLQESLSLKAFLRVNKESRRDHLISTIEPSHTPIQSPEKLLNSTSITATARTVSTSFHDENHSSSTSSSKSTNSIRTSSPQINTSSNNKSHSRFSLSYDPANVVSSPVAPTMAPKSPLQSNDYFVDMSHDESKLPMNQRFGRLIYIRL